MSEHHHTHALPNGKENNLTGCPIGRGNRGGATDRLDAEDTSLWDIPRIGVSEEHLPLYLLLEIEGLTGPALAARFRRLLGRR